MCVYSYMYIYVYVYIRGKDRYPKPYTARDRQNRVTPTGGGGVPAQMSSRVSNTLCSVSNTLPSVSNTHTPEIHNLCF